MTSSLLTALLWITALSSGLMAGVYFAFSGFIMKAFSNLEIAQSIADAKNPGGCHVNLPPYFLDRLTQTLIYISIFTTPFNKCRIDIIKTVWNRIFNRIHFEESF